MTPFTLLGLLIDAGQTYNRGKTLLENEQWSVGAAKLLEAVDVLEKLLGHSSVRDLFDRKDANKEEWQTGAWQFRQALEEASRQAERKLGRDVDLPFGADIICQIAKAKAHILFDEGMESLRGREWWKNYLNPLTKPKEAIAKLKSAIALFGLCTTFFDLCKGGTWSGLLQAAGHLAAIYLAPVIFILAIGVGVAGAAGVGVDGITRIKGRPARNNPTPIPLPDISFSIRCFDDDEEKRFDIDDQEPVAIPISDAVIIETSVAPRSVDTQKVTPVDPGTTTNGARQFLYSPDELGLDIVDFSFFTHRTSYEYVTRSLVIEVVPKGEGGLCYQ